MILEANSDKMDFKPDMSLSPIKRLAPGTKHHAFVLQYLQRRIKVSEDEMQKFYPRWRMAEKKQQAYMNLPKYEKLLKDMNKNSEAPAPAIIVYPYQFAVISTIVTYLTRVFCGRKPIFQCEATSQETAQRYRQMETMLQYQSDYTKLVMKLFQFFYDGELYGVAAMKTLWRTRKGRRSIMRPPTPAESTFGMDANKPIKDYKEQTLYAGNECDNIDPYMFLPDPSVPMCRVAQEGEWVFWRNFIGKHLLLKDEKAGLLNYVTALPPSSTSGSQWWNLSARNLMSEGNASAGAALRNKNQQSSAIQFDQGTIEIIPSELGLGDSEYPEKWIFAIGNGKQILQAEPLDYDHQEHPVSVSEPYTMGYGFGQPSMADYVAPIQDIVSWFIDSHIYNVRASLNNMFVYDPSRIEGQDLKNPKPGKLIRMKPAGVGQDVRQMLAQMPVQDVTSNHMNDLQNFIRIGDVVSSVNDNMRGVNQTGGRKTATEVRVSGDSAASRLAAHAQMISAQAITQFATQMCLNTQQFQEDEMYLKILGQEEFSQIGPAELMGNFNFPIHDGTLPLDRMAAFDIWKEILLGLGQDQELRQAFSFPKLFEFVAQQGGATNISQFRTSKFSMMADGEFNQQVEAGNLAPVNELPQGAPPQ